MIDPFAAALGVLHRAAGSAAADYTDVTDGITRPIRIVWAQGSDIGGARSDRRVADTNSIDVMRSDVLVPARGDTVDTTDPVTGLPITLRINGAPILDAEGLTWTCPAEPV